MLLVGCCMKNCATLLRKIQLDQRNVGTILSEETSLSITLCQEYQKVKVIELFARRVSPCFLPFLSLVLIDARSSFLVCAAAFRSFVAHHRSMFVAFFGHLLAWLGTFVGEWCNSEPRIIARSSGDRWLTGFVCSSSLTRWSFAT